MLKKVNFTIQISTILTFNRFNQLQFVCLHFNSFFFVSNVFILREYSEYSDIVLFFVEMTLSLSLCFNENLNIV